jgi:hypothetical protein
MVLGHLLAALIAGVLDLGTARLLVPLLAGVMVGLLQWVVLRGYLVSPADWILTGGGAWAAGYALGSIVVQLVAGPLLATLFSYLLFGAIVGLAQWPILRREIPNAFPWVVANIAGWAAGALLSQQVVAAVSGGGTVGHLASTAIGSGVTGVVAGAITGLVFVWIVRKPDQPVTRAEIN